MSVPVLRSAHVYPVKSLAARACDTVAVEPWGLDGDRRWMLVDKAAKAVTQRQQPSLARIAAEPLPGCGVLLSAPGFSVPARRGAGIRTHAHRGAAPGHRGAGGGAGRRP
ncbi:MOSC N-terminal beta barrel domain-containing protein [Streptomyces anulatus]|uniref:MOSC N-terminal beta barrel domain-containing protein n=1 Tax=Streptomyces anulatus TaxID=1892 RepID=UPI00255C2BDE|nr:MOSC N-terminal beta barrel domain-containing protein [Streptomyces anulatus]WIY74603.1 MOSC N-terminal beta barrel domain-containing protein [Streptomyces anulatus]